MRHNKKINHLGRTDSHRKAMLSNMAASLILHKKIVTTLAKAKALRVYVEPLITKSKKDNVHSRRTVFSYLQNKFAVKELFTIIADKIAERPGGYTRILKTGNRLGDNAEMCLIELVDFNETLLKEKQTKKSKSTRRSRSKKTKDSETNTPVTKKSTKKTAVNDAQNDRTNDEAHQDVEYITIDDSETATTHTEESSVIDDIKKEDVLNEPTNPDDMSKSAQDDKQQEDTKSDDDITEEEKK